MTTSSLEFIRVEVVYATPETQPVVELDMERGSTVNDAICKSGLLERFPEIDLGNSGVGVFSHPCGLEDLLADGDRVEIYRPLLADPKEVRRQLAAVGKTMGNKK